MKTRSLASLFVLWFTVGWMAMVRLEAQQTGLPPEVLHYADTVLYNGKILTADEKFTIVEAVAIRDGKFLAVGPTARILPMAGPNTRRIDLRGRTVVPGIIDLHQHPFTEQMMKFWREKWVKNEPAWTTPEEALEGIKRVAEKAKPGEMVLLPRIAIGGGQYEYSESGGAIQRSFCEIFTLQQIDSVSPNTPIFFIGL